MNILKLLANLVDNIRTRAPIVYNAYASGNASTNTAVNLWSVTEDLPKGRYLIWISLPIRTSSQTAKGELLINGSVRVTVMTNRTTDDLSTALTVWDNPSDLKNASIALRLAAQSTAVTAYSAAYSYRSAGIVHLSRKIGGGYFLKSILTLLLGVGAGHEHYKTAYESCSWKTEKRLDTCFRLRDKCKDVSKSCYEWLLGSVRRNYIWRYSRLPFNSCIGIKHVNINVCVWYMARHTIQSKSFANVNEYEYSTARLFCEHAIIRKINRQGVCLC